MPDPQGTLTIDASALNGVNFDTYVADYFAGLAGGSYEFYAGTPDSFYGQPYNMNGDQVAFQYEVDGTPAPETVVFGGEEIAYDYIHHGPTFGHGISGELDSIAFGQWTAETTGTPGTGDAGAITGLGAGVTISGFDLSVAPGTGPASQLSTLFNAAQMGDAAALYAYFGAYAQNFIGSAGDDTFTGGEFDDSFAGNGGTDAFNGAAGVDSVDLDGAAADYEITTNEDGTFTVASGGDSVKLTNVEQARFDDATFDFRTGEWTETNFAPEDVALDGDSVKENAAEGTLVGTLSATDPEGDAITWSLTGASAKLFSIEGNQLFVKGDLDYEAGSTQEVTVVATDSYDNSLSRTFTIDITDVNEAPTAFRLSDDSVRETLDVGSTVSLLDGTDPDGGELEFSLVSDAGGLLRIEGDELILAEALDYEKADSHAIRIMVTDADGRSHSEKVKIEVQDVRETISGTDGDDMVRGTDGDETLKGHDGNDTLKGFEGSDLLVGGKGEDTFVFSTALGDDVDEVADFSAKKDSIDLDLDFFGAIGKSLSDKEFVVGSEAEDAKDHVIYNKNTGELFYDVDGSGKKDAVLFATLDSGLKLDADNFFMV